MATEDAGGELARLLGETLDGKYRLERVLGRGGMGVVYQATHLGTRRTVAVKVIAPRFVEEPEFVERFRREAEASGRLRHPNVVDVTDFGICAAAGRRLAYLVMEYLDGCSLEEVLQQEGQLPLRWAADILDQACSAVAEAHRRGIVHRDLKPSNLWLEPDRRGAYRVKVLDFGLAKLADAAEGDVERAARPPSTATAPRELERPTRAYAASPAPTDAGEPTHVEEQETLARSAPAPSAPSHELTRMGATLGTPLYMSPEQCRGEPAGARSDVYSLGVIAYRMLSGRTPFAGREIAVIRQHLEAPPPPLDAGRKLPKAVAELVMSALAKDPAQRPATPSAFGTALVARSEGAGAILRDILTVFVDRPRLFLGIVAAGLAPAAGVALLGAVAAATLKGAALRIALPILGFGGLLALMAGMMAAGAVYQPVVAQLLAMPLRPVELQPLVQALRRRFRAFARLLAWFLRGYVTWLAAPAAAAVGLVFLLRLLSTPATRGWPIVGTMLLSWVPLAVWLARVQDSLGFAASVVLMEGLEGDAARARSADLARHSKRYLPGFEAVRASILVAAMAGGVAAGSFFAKTADPFSLPVRFAIGLMFLPLILVPLALAMIANALLYFRARQAAGEPLSLALEQFEKDALPAGYWERQIRDRIRLQVESSR